MTRSIIPAPLTLACKSFALPLALFVSAIAAPVAATADEAGSDASAQQAPLAVDTNATTSLTLTLTGIANPSGTISVGVFLGQESYDAGAAVTGANVTVDAAEEVVIISGLEPGEYGLKLFHDVNGNGKMDTNPFGMPVEPFAFSNNAKGRFGPAAWDAARFSVSAEGATHSITIN